MKPNLKKYLKVTFISLLSITLIASGIYLLNEKKKEQRFKKYSDEIQYLKDIHTAKLNELQVAMQSYFPIKFVGVRGDNLFFEVDNKSNYDVKEILFSASFFNELGDWIASNKLIFEATTLSEVVKRNTKKVIVLSPKNMYYSEIGYDYTLINTFIKYKRVSGDALVVRITTMKDGWIDTRYSLEESNRYHDEESELLGTISEYKWKIKDIQKEIDKLKPANKEPLFQKLYNENQSKNQRN